MLPDASASGELKTPLKTKRCRWSNSESERSARKFVIVLRLEQRLQIGRIVDRVRPGV